MSNPFDPNIPLMLSHSFALGSGWSVAPELKADWKPFPEAGTMLAAKTVTVTFKLAF